VKRLFADSFFFIALLNDHDKAKPRKFDKPLIPCGFQRNSASFSAIACGGKGT
jgi:hypothetical protein